MSAGYYDYQPVLTLQRPVAFTGHPGSAFREIVYDLAALTGLPLHDLDRLLEHDAGQSLWALARSEGVETLHRMEGERLPGLLATRPAGLVVLGEGSLLDPDRLAPVRAAAGLVFMTLPLQRCYWALRQRTELRHGILGHPWLPDRLDDPEQLQPVMGMLEEARRTADLVIDLESQGVHPVVQRLQEELPRLGADPESREADR